MKLLECMCVEINLVVSHMGLTLLSIRTSKPNTIPLNQKEQFVQPPKWSYKTQGDYTKNPPTPKIKKSSKNLKYLENQ